MGGISLNYSEKLDIRKVDDEEISFSMTYFSIIVYTSNNHIMSINRQGGIKERTP